MDAQPSMTRAKALARNNVPILSPLRYPGAKRRLGGYVAETLRLNRLRPKLFVEPFAGGASVALQLLSAELVEKIALGERDPLVGSFWKVAFFDTDWLIRRLRSATISLATWKRQRSMKRRDLRSLAFACLFLNRTSFSGILAPTAGPIGGQSQASDYDIGCRFTIATLERRLRQLAELRSQVEFIRVGDYSATIEHAEKLKQYAAADVFYYFDPPFFNKADRLYTYFFEPSDHTTFRDTVVAMESPWLLSYDAAPEIANLYQDNGSKKVDLIYSTASSKKLTQAKELIVTNLPQLPKRCRLWRSQAEWREPQARSAVKLPLARRVAEGA